MRVQVMLSDELYKKVENYCQRYGCTKSALLSIAIGQYIEQLEKASNAMDIIYDNAIKNSINDLK